MKKTILLIAIFTLILAGCGKKQEILMDQPAEDGNFYYQNKDLGFSITLPPEFDHYQTQRKESGDFIDLEFFVPTSDIDYPQEVPGYGKPIVVRIFKKQAWEAVDEADKISFYHKLGEKEGKVYTIKVWRDLPEDWRGKWTARMEEEIIKSFEIK
jgi:hypothetical protein